MLEENVKVFNKNKKRFYRIGKSADYQELNFFMIMTDFQWMPVQEFFHILHH
jgi:hypothetical protein